MDFPATLYRAQAVRVVDGDTVDLCVDTGFHAFRRDRFRLLGINAPELNAKDQIERVRATAARQKVVEWLHPPDKFTLSDAWPLLVSTEKSDNFGRWLARVYIDEGKTCINDELVRLGLAVPYRG